MRFVRQRRKNECFPVAIANALKFYGSNFNYKKNGHVLRDYFSTAKEGTAFRNIRKALKKRNEVFKVAQVYDNAFPELIQGWLLCFGTLIATTTKNGVDYHSYFMYSENGKMYAVNFNKHETVTKLSYKQLTGLLQKYDNNVIFIEAK